MRRFAKIDFSLLVALACLSATAGEPYLARIVGVIDGDTVKARPEGGAQRTIRLSGINAPEKGQAYGERSRQSLATLAMERDALIEPRKRDRFGREVSLVRVGSTDMSFAQLEAGMAWHFKRYSREQPAAERLAYARSEESARARKAGLWGDPSAVAPWDWRKERKADQRGGARVLP